MSFNATALKRTVLILFSFTLSACAGWATIESKSSSSTAYKLSSIRVRLADNANLPIFIAKSYTRGPDKAIVDITDRTNAQNALAQTTTLFRQSASQSIKKLLKSGNVQDDAEITLVLTPINANYDCWSNNPSEPCIVGSIMSAELKAALVNEKSNSELWSVRIKTKLHPEMRGRKNGDTTLTLLPHQIIRNNIVGERSNDVVLMDQFLSKLIETLESDGWLANK